MVSALGTAQERKRPRGRASGAVSKDVPVPFEIARLDGPEVAHVNHTRGSAESLTSTSLRLTWRSIPPIAESQTSPCGTRLLHARCVR